MQINIYIRNSSTMTTINMQKIFYTEESQTAPQMKTQALMM